VGSRVGILTCGGIRQHTKGHRGLAGDLAAEIADG
jgi:hypothetical protein